MEQTLSIIKPDAVKKGVIGKIIDRFESNGLRIAAMKKMQLSDKDAGEFYAVHKERPFYGELIEFMTSGPVVVMVLEGENAVLKNRELMGATNPKEAEKGTIRADFAEKSFIENFNKMIETKKIKSAGIILNGVKLFKNKNYGYSYGYGYGYGYDYGYGKKRG